VVADRCVDASPPLSAWYFLPLQRVPVVVVALPVVASEVVAVSEVIAVSGVDAVSGVIAVSGVDAVSGVIASALPIVAAASEVVAVSEVIAAPVARAEVKAIPVKALPVVKALPDVKAQADVKTQADVKLGAEKLRLPAKPISPAAKKAVEGGDVPHGDTHGKVKPVTANVAPVAIKQISAEQQANADFIKAGQLVQQGNSADALATYESVLRQAPGHEAARRAMISLLLDAKRATEAEQVLQVGLNLRPANAGFSMLLARLQVARGALDLAIETLETTLPHAVQQAEYQAFYAALLQRKARHLEAVEHYQQALKTAPNSGVWLMGYGISLQALSRTADAKIAFQRALDTKTLSADLQSFVQQKINGL
jgi:MSHA biogenesis protein MshN